MAQTHLNKYDPLKMLCAHKHPSLKKDDIVM